VKLEAEKGQLKDELKQAELELRKFDLFQDVEESFDPASVVGSAVSLCPVSAAPVERLADISARLKDKTDREAVIKTIRDVSLGKAEDRPYSGYLNAKDIDENRWAFEQARQIMQNTQTDAVLGLERGGKLLSETALAGMEEPRPSLETIAKADVKTDTGEMVRQMKALVDSGKRNLSMIDVNMGGGSLQWMKKQADALMKQLKQEGRDAGVTVTIIMLSEQFGFAANVRDGIGLDPNAPPGVNVALIPVRFVGGDDVDRIAGDDAGGKPLGVFDDEGRAAPIPQDEEHGRTPREQFIKLMNPSA
jgi:hypothetical protein